MHKKKTENSKALDTLKNKVLKDMLITKTKSSDSFFSKANVFSIKIEGFMLLFEIQKNR